MDMSTYYKSSKLLRLPQPGSTSREILLRLQYRADFDCAARGQRRDSHCERNRLIAVLALNQVITAELLLGFRERPIRDGWLPVLIANGNGARALVELCAGQELTVFLEGVDETSVLAHDLLALRIGESRPRSLVEAA